MRHKQNVVALAGLLILTGCTGRPLSDKPVRGGDGGLVAACRAGEGGTTTTILSGELRKEIDLLFVIDNSAGTAEQQTNLAKNFPKLIEALRTPRLNNKIPNVRIGVTSIDLGAGSYGLPGCEQPGGDGGRLLAKPQVAGCVPPSKSWIDYMDGVVNVPNPTIKDPIEKVKRAFQCIAELGTGGCGFEMPLEAARRALDPKRNVNPGFLRRDALLVLVFLTDEDDCSAKRTELFDPKQTQFGPLTSFRCFEFGVQCTCPGGPCTRTTEGERSGCRPKDGWLHRVEDYVAFFKGLKPQGRVMAFAIAGPAAPVKVKLDVGNPTLGPSCQSTLGSAAPAVRLKAFVDGFGAMGHFNEGLDASGNAVRVTTCSPDYGPALRNVGRWIVASLHDPCLPALPLTPGCELACVKGEQVDTTTGASCAASCLHRAACQVEELSWTTGAVVRTIPRCASDRFYDASISSCGTGGGTGGDCPCWRLVRSSACKRGISGSPYRLDVLRPTGKSAPVRVRCGSATAPWGGAGALGQCW